MGKLEMYNIIYADPPWSFRAWSKKKSRTADSHYSVMSIDELRRLEIQASENCALFLWIPNSVIPEGLELMRDWGFEYKTVAFTWVKTVKDGSRPIIGMGHYTRQETEKCFLGMRGRLLVKSHSVEEVVFARRTEHSKKPDIIRKKIVELFGNLPRIEMFARDVSNSQYTEGWDFWGDEK